MAQVETASSYRRKEWTCKAGSLENLRLEERDVNEPLGADQVRIRVRAIGLNLADVFAILGLYSATPVGAFVPGLELAGDVEAVGEKVAGIRVGMRVMAVTRFGAYATRVCCGYQYVRELPEEWSYAHGASFVCQALTAYYAMVELGGCRKGRTVLVHSAAGGVGYFSCKIAERLQCPVVATVGAGHKVDFLRRSFGYDARQIVVRAADAATYGQQLDCALAYVGSVAASGLVSGNLSEEKKEAEKKKKTLGKRKARAGSQKGKGKEKKTSPKALKKRKSSRTSNPSTANTTEARLPSSDEKEESIQLPPSPLGPDRGFDIALDGIAGVYFKPTYDRLRPAGRLVVFGAASMMPTGRAPNWLKLGWQWLRRPTVDPLNMISENKSVMAFNLIWLWEHVEEMNYIYSDMMDLFGDQLPLPHVGSRFPFEKLVEALELFKSGQTIGKVVIEVS